MQTRNHEGGMSKRERIQKTMNFEETDITPTLGGWVTSAEHYQAISNTSPEEFWADPTGAAIQAYKNLDVDGLISLHLPPSQDEFRHLTVVEDKTKKYTSPEDVLEYIKNLPSPDSLSGRFDGKAFYQKFVEEQVNMQRKLGDIVWMPHFFAGVCQFMWYCEFGYENYFSAIALYPDKMKKLFEYSAEEARLKNLQAVKAIKENEFLPILLLGEDICSSEGPLTSPEFLEKYYFPLAKVSLEPLVKAGIKIIWHCDGDVRPVLDYIIELGISGLQGFQEELGVKIIGLAKKRSVSGKKFLFFGSIPVTSVLPYGSTEDVKSQVECSIRSTGGRGIFVFVSNTIGPEVPLENILTMYKYAHQYKYRENGMEIK